MILSLYIKRIPRDGTFGRTPKHIDGCIFSDERFESPLTETTLQQDMKNSADDKTLALLNQLDAWGN